MDEYGIIINCCKSHLGVRDAEEMFLLALKKTIDWDFALSESSHHETLPFLYRRLKELNVLEKIPPRAAERMRYVYLHTLFRNELLLEEYGRICRVFADKKIEHMPLKGAFFLKYLYEDMGLRPMADIDVMVRGGSRGGAGRSLEGDLGYEKVSGEKDSHEVFFNKKKTVTLELHADMDYPIESPRRIIPPGAWDRAVRIEKDGILTTRMSREDAMFSLAMHARRVGKIFIMKYLCDMDRLVRKNQDNIDWDFIAREAKTFRIANLCRALLASSRGMFFTPVPSGVLGKLQPGAIKGMVSKSIVKKALFVKKGETRKQDNYSYLVFYLLTQDRFFLSLRYVLVMDKERFCKFFELPDTCGFFMEMCYAARFFYIPFKLAVFCFHGMVTRIKRAMAP